MYEKSMILNKEILFQNCEDLNVHYTNLIQSGGVFLGINMDDHKVIYASKNFSDIFNYEILYKDLNFLFSHDAILKLISYFKKNNYNGIKSRIFLSLEFKQKNDLVQIPCFLFFSNSTLCIEFQSRLDLNEDKFDEIAYQEMYQYISDFSGNLNELSNNLCKYISEVTGFERTYHCEFQQDEHGFIRANYTSNGLESLLHHHFPASDLPMQVRKIYIKNRFRFISNIDYIKVPIDGCK